MFYRCGNVLFLTPQEMARLKTALKQPELAVGGWYGKSSPYWPSTSASLYFRHSTAMRLTHIGLRSSLRYRERIHDIVDEIGRVVSSPVGRDFAIKSYRWYILDSWGL